MVDNSSAEFEGRGGVRDADWGGDIFLTTDYADCGDVFLSVPSGIRGLFCAPWHGRPFAASLGVLAGDS